MKISDLQGELPEQVIDFYAESDLDELYPPQAKAIELALLSGKNMLVAIPTAAGKTLIAELAMLKSVLEGGKVLYIVPLRALASEKYRRFTEFRSLGIKVGITTGDFDVKDEAVGVHDIIITTSEKADSLLRNQVGWIKDLSIIVADEIHLIDSSDRGPTLEITLAKLMHATPGAQILGLSATISNASELAEWLDATLVESDWRPVELHEGVFLGKAINFEDDVLEVDASHGDDVTCLVLDTISSGAQCLVFENTRKNAEKTALRLSNAIRACLDGDARSNLLRLSEQIRQIGGDTDVSDALASCIECSSAFHHAGLRSEHRQIVEDAFRSNLLSVVVSTPTLAAGINLPARRAVIKNYRRYDTNLGMAPIPVMEYKQMCGRAGRPGLDPYGEAVLIARSYDEFEWLRDNYVLGVPEDIYSRLGTENALRTHILSSIASGYAKDIGGLLDLLRCTFYAHQQDTWTLEGMVNDLLEFLEHERMIVDQKGELLPTELGMLVSRLYVDPLSASTIMHALEEMEASSDATLLHLICKTPDMRLLYLRSGDHRILEEFILPRKDQLIGLPDQLDIEAHDWLLAEIKTAALISEWISETPEAEIVRRFNVYPGDIRRTVDLAEWLMHALAEISAIIKPDKTLMARELVQQIKHGADKELLALTSIPGIGRARARKLYNAGYTHPRMLVASNVRQLKNILGDKTAEKVLKRLLSDEEYAEIDADIMVGGQSRLMDFE